MSGELRLGPMLRHVTETTATIWVETDRPGQVTVVAGVETERAANGGAAAAGDADTEAATATASASTFTVHGHHYALVDLVDLEPGSALPYRVLLDGAQVWPLPDSPHPPSLVRTVIPDTPVRVAFGSCRKPAGHTPADNARHGPDMLRAYAATLQLHRLRPTASVTTGPLGPTTVAGYDLRDAQTPASDEPTVLLLIGDQVYADALQPPMLEYLRDHRPDDVTGRRSAEDPPDDEVVFFHEYAELYRQSWSEPYLRWLLSTVPTFMLCDDHDIRDDWNTSGTWRRQMAANQWWRSRVTSGIGAYWVYQHLGNLAPEDRAKDPVFAAVTAASREGDAATTLDTFSWRAHDDPASYQWSYRYDIGLTRILMVDSRCGRVVTDDTERSMVNPDTVAWLDENVTGDVNHLVLASTLPFLLPNGVHYLEAWNEAVCAGRWGGWARRPGEKLRQGLDLEHWSAFGATFAALSETVLAVASGQRGTPPATVLFLGGDVHFSYLARARPRAAQPETISTIAQLVCSPLRNPLHPALRAGTWLSARRLTAAGTRLLARLAGVRAPQLRWRLDSRLHYVNALATLHLAGRSAEVVWEHGLSVLGKRPLPEERGRVERIDVAELFRRRLTL